MLPEPNDKYIRLCTEIFAHREENCIKVTVMMIIRNFEKKKGTRSLFLWCVPVVFLPLRQ